MTRPEWRDGKPANLAAAAMDADEWLELLEQAAKLHPDDKLALVNCRAALAAMLKGES